MKKFNNWMLTNHPLIWNTRFHIMLPLVILLNIIFFFWGYCQDITLKNISYFHYYQFGFINGVAILVGIMTMLLWLIFYLRHNAFKALLPLSMFHLQKEFAIVLIIFLGLIFPIMIAHKGMNYKINRISKSVNTPKEKRIIFLAQHFLPFELGRFNAKKVYQPGNDNDTGRFEQGMIPGVSYLNYRGSEYYNEGYIIDKDSLLDIKAISWLKDHRKDSIITYIDKYLQLCKKYGGEYKFNSTAHVSSIFSTTDLLVKEEIPTDKYDKDEKVNNRYIQTPYVSLNAIEEITDARKGLKLEQYFACAIVALGFCFVLFSFRITPIKTWISAIVMAVILTVGTVTLYIVSNNERILILSPVVLAVASLCISAGSIFQKKRKYLAGVTYLLTWIVLPFFVLAVYGFLYEYTQYGYYEDVTYIKNGFTHQMHDWLKDNDKNFLIANFIFALLMALFVMIPLIKKWRANPEE
ncbi:hypothetical protein [Pinibacter aurantiacus]|uniref:Uncharacterized protein n=1 Tax=Pinibacter aurantiacus TaxID=2851599 RepID=A0A9E2S9E8_9BACT|nr:hypothetical protein [Pinibacter aurantiacus]MBV4357089.1 hypothetical protein [Pinibacter aurantiacus]